MQLSSWLPALLTPWQARDQQPLCRTCVGPSGPALPGLLDASLEDLQSALYGNFITEEDLVAAYTARISEVNPQLRAVTEVNPDALSAARSLRVARRGSSLGPLHGLPVLVKNNIATADATNTTAGSHALLGATVPHDSTVASRLRAAGAVLLGKANLSQWSSARGRNISNGWSAHGGQVKGAYCADQDPSGSSSGSAVAVSLGLAWAALGTETAGSILLPACFANIVGLKPTVGLTSRHLVVPISEHQDTVGPLARTVRDAAHLLSAIAGRDERDNYTSAIPWTHKPDYVGACVPDSLRYKRLGVPRHMINLTYLDDADAEVVMRAFNASIDLMRKAGAEVVDGIYLPGYDQLAKPENSFAPLLRADMLVGLKRYFSQLTRNPNNITDLALLRNWTQHSPKEGYPQRDTYVFDAAVAENTANDGAEFWANYTRNVRWAGEEGVTGALDRYRLDALVLPTYAAVVLPAVLGSPVISVPMGWFPSDTKVRQDALGVLNVTAPNVPFGIGFMGRPFAEETLVGVAYGYEQLTMVRRKVVPLVVPETELADVVRRRKGDAWGDL